MHITADESTANLNVLHETGLRENFITLVEDMSALHEWQSPALPAARRAELEALAIRYGLNPRSPDFAAVVQGLRAAGKHLGSDETVIYFGDDDVWVDPAVRERLAALRVSFRKLGDPNASLDGEERLVRLGQALKAQSVKPESSFDDRWVPGRRVGADELLSEAAPQLPAPAIHGEHQSVPGDVTSLLLATRGEQVDVNEAPRVAGESIRSNEDVPLLIDPLALLANDRDVEQDALVISGIARVALGRAELLGNGQIHYTPPSDMYGVTDTLDYIVRDGRGASAIGRLRIALAAVDDAPTVVAERLIHAREDQRLRIAPHLLLRNDIDPDTDARLGARPLRVAAVGSAGQGSVQMDGDGQILFVPDADFNGETAFSYTVMDESGLATTGRAWIRIDAVNDAPLAAGEHIAGREDEGLEIDAALLLKNDIDTDIARGEQQRLSVVAVDEAIGGTAILRDGLIHFTPQADLAGAASFRYLLSDGQGGFAQATVDVTLAPVNDAPRLAPLHFECPEDAELLLPASRLLDAATDVDGDARAIRLLRVGKPEGGTVSLVDGELRFAPAADFAEVASFTYTVADGQGGEADGVALVDVNNVNDAPRSVIGARMALVADEDQEIRIAESALLQLLADADGDPLSLVVDSLSSDGAGDRLHFDEARRELVLRAAPDTHGQRQIRFAVTDGQAITYDAIDLRLRPVNDAPVVNAFGFLMLEDGGDTDPTKSAWSFLSHDLLLSGASDMDGDALSIASVSEVRTTGEANPQPVELVDDAQARRIGIRAPLNYHGAIEFQFNVSDGQGGETTQKAYGVVAPVNDTPMLTVQQTGESQRRLLGLSINRSTWQIAAWDPDEPSHIRLATERNPLRGSVALHGQSTAPDPRGGQLTVATINTLSGFGNATTTETSSFSATDSSGAQSTISISFTGRYNTDPIVIDFDQDGLRFIDLEHSRAMLEVDGVARRSAWIGPNEGILAFDADRDGRIRRLDEIAFGSHVGQPEISDLQALQQALFDQNRDGIFDAADEKWASFLIWRDLNGNGFSDDGELQSLDEAGVRGLALYANVLNRAEGADVRVRGYTRALMHDGSLRQAADVWLRLEDPQEEGTAASEPDPSMQQVSLLGADPLASLLRQLADAPQEGNRAPLVYGYLPTQHAEEGQPFRLEIAPNLFLDADTDDPLRIEASLADGRPLPDWLRFDGHRLLFEGTPAMADAGDLSLALTAVDRSGASSRVGFTLVTTQVNPAPDVATPVDLLVGAAASDTPWDEGSTGNPVWATIFPVDDGFARLADEIRSLTTPFGRMPSVGAHLVSGAGSDINVLSDGGNRAGVIDSAASDALMANEVSGANLWGGVTSTDSGVNLNHFSDPGGGIATDSGIEWLRFAGGEVASAAMLAGMIPASAAIPSTTPWR